MKHDETSCRWIGFLGEENVRDSLMVEMLDSVDDTVENVPRDNVSGPLFRLKMFEVLDDREQHQVKEKAETIMNAFQGVRLDPKAFQ